ncbi:hypothetical protein DFQ28_004617, partial [Apophysomyces sp. BC1034]
SASPATVIPQLHPEFTLAGRVWRNSCVYTSKYQQSRQEFSRCNAFALYELARAGASGQIVREMFFGETQFFIHYQHEGDRRILAVVRFYKDVKKSRNQFPVLMKKPMEQGMLAVVDVDGLVSTAGLLPSVESDKRFHIIWPYGNAMQNTKFGNPARLA